MKRVVRLSTWVLTVFFVCLTGPLAQLTVPRPDYLDAVWIAKSDKLVKLDAASGSAAFEITDISNWRASAVDEIRGTIWAYNESLLRSYSFGGILDVSVVIAEPEIVADDENLAGCIPETETDLVTLDPRVGIAVNSDNGSVWLAVEKDLYHLDDQGQLLQTIELSGKIRGIAFDPTTSWVWIATKRTLRAFDNAGNQASSLVPGSCPILRDMDIDDVSGDIWIALRDELRRYSSAGTLEVSIFQNQLQQISADDQEGAWFATAERLMHVDALGLLTADLVPFDNGLAVDPDGSRIIIGLAADPLDAGVWVSNHSSVLHLDSQGNTVLLVNFPAPAPPASSDVRHLSLYIDRTTPTLTFSQPASGALINTTTPLLELLHSDVGQGVKPTSLEIESSGQTLAVSCTSLSDREQCTPTSALPQGSISLTATIEDWRGNLSSIASLSFSVDSIAPTITVDSPANGLLTNNPSLTFNGEVSESSTLTLDGSAVTLAADLQFTHGPLTLAEGLNSFHLEATDPAGNVGTKDIQVTLDTTPPVQPDGSKIQVSALSSGQVTLTAAAGSVEAGATVRITNTRTGQFVTVTAAADGSFSAAISAQGSDVLKIEAIDATLNASHATEKAVIPPDPTAVAPALDRTVVTHLSAAAEFLFAGTNPVQSNVTPGTITAERIAVLRGRVLNKNGLPIPEVIVDVLGHPEFGQTVTRTDGRYDMAVNGGGQLTLRYRKFGYFPAQRQAKVPWRDYVSIEDVVLIEPDSQVTVVDFSDPIEVARGSSVTDSDGTRRATLLFRQGTTATMKLGDGSTQNLSSITVRATEYTVGANGPQSMPAPLPPTSGYTYAVELSADEAISHDAIEVSFSQPVPFYVENFLNFPVGQAVPAGWYDRTKAAWIPSENGRVIKILSITSGLADLDVDGSGTAADSTVLAALGIDDTERESLASLYTAGQSLWRVPVGHFTPWDCNWPYAPPADARGPDLLADITNFLDNPCSASGSMIECENQILGESLPVSGTPFRLHYQSDRVPGMGAARRVEIPLTGGSLPASLKRVDLVLDIAGRQFKESFAPLPNQNHTFIWDGQDAYGRTLQGSHLLTIQTGYIYDGIYMQPAQLNRAFGAFSGTPITASESRQEVTIWQEQQIHLGTWDARFQHLGAWTLDIHHAYDPNSRTLYLGDGRRRSVESTYQVVTSILSSGISHNVTGLDVAPDGSIYFSIGNFHIVKRLNPDGSVATVAGTGSFGYNGDNIPATQARLASPRGISLASDGSLYIADQSNHRIRKVAPDGIITTVAGTGSSGFSGDGGPATLAQLSSPDDVAVGPDGSFYIAEFNNFRVRRVGSDGVITTVAGTGQSTFNGDNRPATTANIRPLAVAVDPAGSIYINDRSNRRIRRVGQDGIIRTVAGNGGFGYTGDGGLAINAHLGSALDLEFVDGDLFIVSDGGSGIGRRVRRVDPAGFINHFAGNANGTTTYGQPATQFNISTVSISADQEGLFLGDASNIRKVGSALPGFSFTDFVFPSEDGQELYIFSSVGKHLVTKHALTGATLFEFIYDPDGRVIQIQDGDGDVTAIVRDAQGNPTAITAHDGQQSTFTHAHGYLSTISDSASQTHSFTYTSGGLMTTMTDPRSQTYQFIYNGEGRLQLDQDPAGGSQALVRTAITDGHEVSRTTAQNRVTRYQTQTLSTGMRRRVQIAPDSTQTQTDTGTDARAVVTTADGTIINTLQGPDPRFGMQVPIAKTQTISTPGGLSFSLSSQRTASLSDPNNLLSLTQQTDQVTINGRTSTNAFNVSLRQWTFTSAAGRQTTTKVDTLGRITEQQITGLDPTTISYDARGRLSTTSVGSGASARTTSLSYDSAGYLETVADALNRVLTFNYDAAGRVTSLTLPDSRVISYAYDGNGNVTSITPPGRPAHTFAFTPVNLESSYTPPDLGAGINSTQYVYNLDRQLTQIQRPDATTVDLGYDTAGRLSTVTIPRGTIQYAYSPSSGNLSTITAPGSNTLSYSYDGSLVTQESWGGEIEGSVSRAYDNNFRVTSETVNGGTAVNFGYDQDGLLTQTGDLALSRNAQNGLLTGSTVGSVADSWGYNSFGEPTSYNASVSGSPLYSVSFTRDKLGRITDKTETVGGLTDTYTYIYDTAGRLEEVKLNGGTTSVYTYDANGNRLSHTTGSGTTNGTYDDQDRLTQYGSASYTYTANGELLTKTVSGQTTTYTYDQLGNLTAVMLPDGTQIEYIIDGMSRRVGKKVNGVLVQGFLYKDGLNPIAELDGAGSVVSRFVYGSRFNVPDLIIRGGVTYRIISDHLGSPRLVVDTATGTIAQRMDFDEFGNLLLDTNPGFQPFGFAGGIFEQAVPLIRFGLRDYDPAVGRFTVKDPIGFLGGNPGLYGYVHNDPINLIDPTGLLSDLQRQDLVQKMTVYGAALGSFLGFFTGGGAGLFAGPGAVAATPAGALYGAAAGSIAGAATGNILGQGILYLLSSRDKPVQPGRDCPRPGERYENRPQRVQDANPHAKKQPPADIEAKEHRIWGPLWRLIGHILGDIVGH